jgi:branched-chain amino acid transport system substrate-binding protein
MRVLHVVRLAAVLAVAGVVGGGVAPAAGAQSSSTTVKVGLQAPLTGDQQDIGQGMLHGAQRAAERLNAAGGIAGAQVEIVPIDDAADPATGVTAANAAIAAGLDGVVGPYNSGVGAATLPLYIQAGLVPIRLTSADSTNGLGLTLQPMTYQIAPVAADALTEWLKADSVAIIYDDSTLYTQTVSAALKSELEAADVTISAFEPIQPGASSYTTTLDKVAATDPDVIYLATYYPEGGLIAKEMYDGKVDAKCVADYGAYSDAFVDTAGTKAARRCPVVGVPAPDEFSSAKKYVAAYKKEFGAAPGVWSPYTYDSVDFLAAGVEAAGGWDAAALSSALAELSGFSGWTGSVTIDPATGNREPATVVVLRTDKRGAFHVNEQWAKAVDAQI